MKKTTILLVLLLSTAVALESQESIPKYISVTGTAEKIVEPDLIEVHLSLQRYESNTISSQLKYILIDLKGLMNKLRIDYVEVYKPSFFMNLKPDEPALYSLKFKSKSQFYDFLSRVDKKAVECIRITNVSNSKYDKHRMQVQQEALNNALNSASNLLGVLDRKTDNIIAIGELPLEKNYFAASSLSPPISKFADFNLKEPRSIRVQYGVCVKYGIL